MKRSLVFAVASTVAFIACSSSDTTPTPSTVDAGSNLDAGAGNDASTDAGGGSNGPCTAGQTRCAGSPAVSIERCDANGAWQPDMTCPYACSAGACVGVCGEGSTQCCEKQSDGTIGCDGQMVQGCIGGATCVAPHPAAIVVRTCNAVGQWVETSTCGQACSPDPGATVVACGICNRTATCLQNVNDTCACAQ